MVEVDLPKPVIKIKPYDKAIEQHGIEAGLHPIVARIVASRPLPSHIPLLQAISPKLKNLSSPLNLKDIERAASRVADAIINAEYIGIETDHDCDGQTSHAVLFHNLIHHFKHPKQKILSYIGHRLTEGYGLSEPVAKRILSDSPRCSLVITADNGSSDEPRIKQLKAAGIDVIITDHHEIPVEGAPLSAYACLNPTRSECGYGDPYIAGCMVAWLLMAATRQVLIERGHLCATVPTLMDSLDFVAVGTIADCVSMARSINNRAVVAYGIRLITEGKRPCWRAILSDLKEPLNSEDLGFRIGPLLNSDGRLSCAFGSVNFLLAETDEEAMAGLFALEDHNKERKNIQQNIVLQGLSKAKSQVDQGRSSLCIYLQESHTGVHGIAASRIKDIYGRPTAFFAPKLGVPGVISGSIRGVEKFHVRQALQYVADQHPHILIAFGGHKGAGGLTLKLADFELFSATFEAAACLQLAEEVLLPVIWTDGPLSLNALNFDLINTLSQLEPFGREFETPVFEVVATLKELRFIGDGTHARVRLEAEGKRVEGVWFKIRQTPSAPIYVQAGDTVKVAFSIKINNFRNERKVDMQVVHMEALV